MIWNSWGDFVAMGGYALYVWASVLMVFAAMAIEVVSLVWRRRSIEAELSLAQAVRRQRAGRDRA